MTSRTSVPGRGGSTGAVGVSVGGPAVASCDWSEGDVMVDKHVTYDRARPRPTPSTGLFSYQRRC